MYVLNIVDSFREAKLGVFENLVFVIFWCFNCQENGFFWGQRDWCATGFISDQLWSSVKSRKLHPQMKTYKGCREIEHFLNTKVEEMSLDVADMIQSKWLQSTKAVEVSRPIVCPFGRWHSRTTVQPKRFLFETKNIVQSTPNLFQIIQMLFGRTMIPVDPILLI